MLNQKGTSSDARLVLDDLDDPVAPFFFKMSDQLCFVLSHCSNRKHSTVKVKPEYNELSYLVTRQCLHQEEFNQLSQYDRVKPTRKCSWGLLGIVEENSGLERGVLITSGKFFFWAGSSW